MEEQCFTTSIRTFLILDLETTGLPFDKPVRITEIALVAAMREHVLGFGNGITGNASTALPRVLSKMNLCVYPRRMISGTSSELTHLTNELLEHQSPFDENLCNMLDGFISRLAKPVCIIAHNGLKFDFPVLQAELQRIGKVFPDQVICADSLTGFREIFKRRNVKGGINDEHGSILKDIQFLHNSEPLQELKVVTNPKSSNINSTPESDLHLNDYDEQLCSVVEAVECRAEKLFDTQDDHTCYIASETVETLNVTDQSLSKVKESCYMENEICVLQQLLEKTPDRTTSLKAKSNFNREECQAHTPNVESSAQNLPKRARKRLNFTAENEIHVPKSYKLKDIYRFLLKKDPVFCHQAEGDALCLLECIVALGPEFVDWVDKNAIPFNNIKKLE